MAGDDEARARAVLTEMQMRIAEGPTSALGIGEIVTADDVRTAFLGLTKQFHPARFGRLSGEIQKLSNEVFLGIKAAHDHMLKVLGSSAASIRGGSRPSNQAVPLAQGAEGTSRTNAPRGSQSIPRIEGTTPPPGRDGRASSPVLGQSRSTPPMGVPVQQRPTTGSIPAPSRSEPQPQRATGSIPIQRPQSPSGSPSGRAITPVPPGTQPGLGSQVPPRQPTPGAGTQPLPRAGTPVPPGTQPGVGTTPGGQRMVRVRTSTGAIINVPANQAPRASGQSSPPPSRTMTPMVSGRPMTPPPEATQPPRPTAGITPPTQPPRPTAGITTQPARPQAGITPPTQPPRPPADGFDPPTIRNVAPPSMTGVDNFDETAAFRDAAALMEQKNWPAARQALHALAARVPQSKQYRAWLCYARGREAYIAGRPEDAVLEMQRALQLDPDLAHAKHALAELQRRR